MPTVDTKLGRVRGAQRDGYQSFRGIRYAQPPVDLLRFKPPMPIIPWVGEYNATEFGPSAIQPPPETDSPLAARAEPISEDCLFLNIYTRQTDKSGRPVLFWIHGGGYVSGSGRAYNGSHWVREHDVVVVTINYRMGPLGFLHVGHLDTELSASVNVGIQDQICALEWVQEHIASFGGDPDNITIFGESAGGTSTAMLYGCPRAEGLFHKAIIHSPHVDLIPVGEGHVKFTNRCIERLGGDPLTNGLDTLRKASVDDLLALYKPDPATQTKPNLAFRSAESVSFSPSIDGSLIPGPISETIRSRGTNNPPLMGGGCRHEGTLFAQIVGHQEYNETDAIDFFESEGVNGSEAMSAYSKFAPESTPREKLVYALTDTMFRNSMVRILDATTESGSNCWSWMCTWESDMLDGSLRATHAVELCFLWNWIAAGPSLAGSNAPEDLGKAMRAYWVNFARTGKPSAPGEPAWPTYTLTDRATLVLDKTREVVNDLDKDVREFWAAHDPIK